MTTQNNEVYHPVSKTLHWLTALAALVVFVTAMFFENADGLSPEGRKLLYTLHKSTGFLVLCLMLLRVVWMHGHHPPPLPEHLMPRWQIAAAKIVHRLLYAVAVLTPLFGWALVSMGPHGLSFFGLFPLPSLPLDQLAAVSGAKEIVSKAHETLATLFAALLVVHVGATLLHHFVDRDDILLRISPVCLHAWLHKIRGTQLPPTDR
jgi:cytochrome b561